MRIGRADFTWGNFVGPILASIVGVAIVGEFDGTKRWVVFLALLVISFAGTRLHRRRRQSEG